MLIGIGSSANLNMYRYRHVAACEHRVMEFSSKIYIMHLNALVGILGISRFVST